MGRNGRKMLLMAAGNNNSERERNEREQRTNEENWRRYNSDSGYNASGNDYGNRPNYYYPETENRRRRDSRGRFMRHGGSEYNRMPPHEYGNERRIGFEPENHESGTEWSEQEQGYASSNMRYIDRQTAEEIVRAMHNADGSRGAHWTYDRVEQYMEQRQIHSYDVPEFFIALNMMYSDYCTVAKECNCNTMEFYCKMAKAFLDDPDAREGKLMRYIESVAM